MILKLGVLVLCISYVICNEHEHEHVSTRPCNNTSTYCSDVRMKVSGCKSSDELCPLIRGTNHTVTFTFKPTEDFKDRTDFRVYGVFEKFSVPYGKKANACDGAVTTEEGLSCTDTGGFLAAHEYKHTSKFAVSNNYPKIKLHVRFVMYDRRTKKNMMCLEVPVEIMDPADSANEA